VVELVEPITAVHNESVVAARCKDPGHQLSHPRIGYPDRL
jgi:hypothetical protein